MKPVIGIRREDKNEWERRVPLSPDHVRELTGQGIDVLVQPSKIRVFEDNEYTGAGAIVQEDLSSCNVVFGVKEFPISIFRDNQAYMFFSHTIKGQNYNMPMLQTLLDKNCTLMDYEKITNDKNFRLVFFGNYAGLAGMMETLHTYGKRMAHEGVQNPLAGFKRPLDYPSLDAAKADLEIIGKIIETEGLPEELGPVVVGFAGYGNVSRGAQEILDILPTVEIKPEDLANFMETGQWDRHKVYKVIFYEKDMVVPVDASNEFELQDYFKNPVKYKGVFSQYLDKLSMLVNCIYWTPDYPILVTKDWVKNNWTLASKLKVIGDITCDIEGSIECTLTSTEPGKPVFVYLADTDEMVYGIEGNGPIIMAVDTLPSELPRESSTYFGNQLMPFIAAMARTDYSADYEALELPSEIKKSVIAHKGVLVPDFKYISEFL